MFAIKLAKREDIYNLLYFSFKEKITLEQKMSTENEKAQIKENELRWVTYLAMRFLLRITRWWGGGVV